MRRRVARRSRLAARVRPSSAIGESVPTRKRHTPPRMNGSPPRKSGPVLVVDDDPDVRRAIAKVLAGSGLAVVTAENGIAAKAAIDLHQFVAIVCDIRMEILNGLELFDELK